MATEEDRIDTGVLLTIGAVLTIAVVGVALAVTALVRAESDELVAEKGATANVRPIQELKREQSQALAGTLPAAQKKVLDAIQQDPNAATDPAPVDAATQEATPDAGAEAQDAATETTEAGAEGENEPKPEQPKPEQGEPQPAPEEPEGAPQPEQEP